MKRYIKLSVNVFLSFICILAVNGQDSQESQSTLPQIKLEDYTIIGLEKVVLPHKVRRTISKKLTFEWSQNSSIMSKESPSISFKSNEKPGMTFRNNFTHIDALLDYGSFNTFNAKLNVKLKTGDIIPFIGIDFVNSNGHTDNADFTRAKINGGIEGQLWQNSVVQLATQFRSGRQSLWSSLIPADISRRTKATVWHWQASLEQELSRQFSLFAGGYFQSFDFENRFSYNQNYLSVNTGIAFNNNNTSIKVLGELDHNNGEREFEDTNLNNASIFWKTDYSLYSSTLRADQKIDNISLSVGINAQQLEISNDSKSYLYPMAEVSFNGQNTFYLSVRYQPGLAFQSMDQMLREYPLADFGSYQPLKLKHKIVGVLNIRASTDLTLQISGNYNEFENYPIVYSSYVDSSFIINPQLLTSTLQYVQPYWEYRYINDAKIWDNTFRMTLHLPNKILLEGWLTYRRNEFNALDERDSPVSGNEIPYLPVLSSTIKFEWYFLQKHKLQISGKYIGERYNDVANLIKLKDYFLLGASVDFIIAEQFTLRFFGNNLLDQNYELFHSYSAPGISGGAGIEIKL